MPLIHVYHPADSLSPPRKAALAEQLTAVLLEIEGGGVADNPRGRSIAWVLFHEIAKDSWAIGGAFDDTYVSPPGKFLVRVQVPEGSLSKDRKGEVHKRVFEVFHQVFGLAVPVISEDHRPSLFVMIHEWGEGNAGALGKTWGLADIGGYVGAGDPDIRQRSRAYLQARAAWREAAGFPA